MISLTMIVKNEEQLLPRALANWRALADELIVTDTGSSDKTIEVAKSLGARILHYDWQTPGHKGQARNVGLNAAAGEWIVVQDADEIIQNKANLRGWLLRQPDEQHGAHVFFHNYNEADQVIMKWSQLRCIRRGLYRYKHREHELPQPTDDRGRKETILTDVVFEHRPPPERTQPKIQPMIDRLELDASEFPDDPYPIYFLHRQYGLAGEWDKAIDWGKHYLDMATGKQLDRCECYGNLAHCHRQRGEPNQAIRYLHQAAGEQPHRRIWWIRLAEIYYETHQFNLAMAMLRCAAELWPDNGQHYQPVANERWLYELMQKCQTALATGVHHHG